MASKDEAFAHLDISENLAETIASVSEAELVRFFDSLKKVQQNKIEHCKDNELTSVRDRCKMITEIKGTFLLIRQSAKTKQHNQ